LSSGAPSSVASWFELDEIEGMDSTTEDELALFGLRPSKLPMPISTTATTKPVPTLTQIICFLEYSFIVVHPYNPTQGLVNIN
jgi:hypothetical protein